MCKCTGCGATLQDTNFNDIGYTSNLSFNLCERCFKIKNYNEYKYVIKDNNDFIKILENINRTDSLVVLVVDLFNISQKLEDIGKYLTNKILLVITKRDILPRSCYDKKIEGYFKNYNLNIIDLVIISSIRNYNFDILYEKINNLKVGKNVYVVGFTNAGKSTMINKIIYNYSNNKLSITTSNLPSTTLDSIRIDINDNLTLVDTPGLLDDGDIINYIDIKSIKKIVPNKEIKPITYQLKEKQKIIIDDLAIIDVITPCNLTIYMSNMLNISRIYKNINIPNNFIEKSFEISSPTNVVIQGLGFISTNSKCIIKIYTLDNVNVYERLSLI